MFDGIVPPRRITLAMRDHRPGATAMVRFFFMKMCRLCSDANRGKESVNSWLYIRNCCSDPVH